MQSFRLSRRAETDLVEIARYTLNQWGEEQAVEYIDSLEACCRRLADNPELGRRCEHVRAGLRRMEQGRHVIFYRIVQDGILVARVLHDRMLPERHEVDDSEE